MQTPPLEPIEEHSSISTAPVQRDGRQEVTLVLRRKSALPEDAADFPLLSRDDLSERHGARADDLDRILRFGNRFGLQACEMDAGARTVRLYGSPGSVRAAFGNGRTVPADLEESVLTVLGFLKTPVCRARKVSNTALLPKKQSFTPPQLARLYNFPQTMGKGQTIALIELGGGYKDSDLSHYWTSLGLPRVNVVSISVNGATNQPTGNANGPDGEVVLDINVAGGLAPAATIVVYFAPNTDAGFLNALNAAIHDQVHKPSVISISWGAAEKEWSASTMNAFNAAFQDAAALGITVCAAAGDNGSSDGEADKGNHVDFPASSPWVLACGGTRLLAASDRISSETVWNDGTSGGATGGGVSAFFARPDYQKHLPSSVMKRGVPDVAAVADPQTGYQVFVDGQSCIVGGTSAVAPLWASLIALCNEEIGKPIGFIHPHLYGSNSAAFNKMLHDVKSGTNGAYKAGLGWDSCTGLGSPDGQAILAALRSAKPANS